jgi:hypothetical protein
MIPCHSLAKSSLEEFSIPKKGKRKQEKARGNKKKQEKEGSGFQKRGKTVTVEAS